MAILYRKHVWLLVLFLLVGLLSACNKEFLTEASLANATPEKGVMSVRYEAENLTYQELGDASTATAINKIRAMAKAARSKISIEIYEDGTSDWCLEKMTPKHDVHVNDQTPANPNPQTKLTRVSRSGQASFYSSDGRLLAEQPMPIRSFSAMVSRVRHDPSAVYAVIGIKSKQQVAQLVADAQRKGATIQQLEGGHVSIRSMVTNKQAKGARGAAVNYKSVDIVNPDLGILVGSTLYDDKDRLVNQVFYRYKLSDDKTLVPEAMHQKTWTTNDKTGETYATVSTTYFDNVSATINHN